MARYTKRGRNGKTYATGPTTMCWGNRPMDERAFCAGCHGAKDNRGVDRSKCGPLAIIDRLAAYEDTGLEPEEIKEFVEDVEMRFVLWVEKRWGISAGRHIDIMRAEKDGRLVIESPNPPLTLEELREMSWEPAWVDGDCETEIGHSGYAIIWYSAVEKYVCIWWPGEDTADIPSLDSYGDTWLAYRRKPEEVPEHQADICVVTGSPCCRCNPGPCSSRRSEALGGEAAPALSGPEPRTRRGRVHE